MSDSHADGQAVSPAQVSLDDRSPSEEAVSPVQTAARVLLGAALVFAGVTHLTTKRDEFQAQVPESLPLNKDFTVLASGVVEISLGSALMLLSRRRVTVGWIAAAFFTAIFPGNISQYLKRAPAFGLNTDRARFIRLLFQPLLVLWALWSTGAWPSRRSALNRPPRHP